MKNFKINLWSWLLIIPVLVTFTAAAPQAYAKKAKKKEKAKTAAKADTDWKSKDVKLPDGTTAKLEYKDTKVGTGAEAKAGDTVTVDYVGKLENGTVFDESKSHGQPFTFPLGAGQVIKGWDEGVAGMKIGGTRDLKIPASLGYGAQGAGGKIPPNATLLFTVDLKQINGKTR